jgi:hypothetical protein
MAGLVISRKNVGYWNWQTFTRTPFNGPRLSGGLVDRSKDARVFTISWSSAAQRNFQRTASYILGRLIAFLSIGVQRYFRGS